MADKGLDFKHKEVINITNGKRLRTSTRRMKICSFKMKELISLIFSNCPSFV